MLRVPGAEPVKTRLHVPLGAGAATLLYRCLVLDALEMAAQVPGVTAVAAFSPPGAGRAMAALAPAGMRCLAQRGDDLGARMGNLVDDLLAGGHAAALVTGSDLPALPAAYLREAARALMAGEADVVLGPAEDGGYYLIGLRRRAPELFRGIAWSTAEVLDATRARADALGLRVRLLPPWADLDMPADLVRLRRLLADGEPMAAGGPAWRTRRWMAAFSEPRASLDS
ncbi:MAG TPA: TIGR04282 family arsenosugar biosynthesis glycosyltransferase [Methylomirabilota bacterium]|nr:TIGR04282 family arsenosugar biosynthesis glycosyltransferase [Methylomirabilota bacterium]